MPRKKTSIKVTARTRHDDLPATVGLFKEVRAELIAKIGSVDHKVASLNAKVDSVNAKVDAVEAKVVAVEAKVDAVEAKVVAVEAKIASVDAKVDALEQKMESRFDQVLSIVHRTQTLMEEQRSENRIVLDGIKNLSDRQDRMEERLDGVEHTLQVLVRAKKTRQ